MDTAARLEAFLNIGPDKWAESQVVEPDDFGSVRVSVSSAEKAKKMTAEMVFEIVSDDLLTDARRF